MQFDANRLILATALGLGLAAPAFAQDATPPAPEAPAAEAPAAPAPAAPAPAPAAPAPAGEAAPQGQPTDANPAAPEAQEVIRETFGDWQVRCANEGAECFLYQLALDDAKNPVAEVSLVKLPAGGEAVAGVTVVSPLGTLLTTGVALQIDGNQARQYPFNWCSQVGCFARFGLTQDSITAMKRGKGGKIMLVSVAAPDRPIALDLSLTGFTAAFDSLATPAGAPVPAAPAPAAQPARPPQPTMPSLAPSNN
ncbi:MAG: invasion associated locus B family protein [Rhodovulum sulfidophilum]|uniref:Invasion associated locus B family protein n=1 Tax=Rhodovulum sulfidophilum TaxID=35806 RepID=A0A2W5N5P1_RHOSU|nr:MAG: invasion associated locus B family protein [Rhodovulum sulfidophilum]